MRKLGLAGRLAHAFINSRLTPLIVLASLLLGAGAVLLLPREEEPQIIVPMIDVFVGMPGASSREVEERVTKPMEKLLWEISGVEYVYSITSPGGALCIVRFKVGQDEEKAIVRLNQKLFANFDLIPPGASQPLVKPRSIDDVPILALTLSSPTLDAYNLRRVAAELHDRIKAVPEVSDVRLIGGQRREARVLLDPARLASRGIPPMALAQQLGQVNRQLRAGSLSAGGREVLVETGDFLRSAAEVERVVVGVREGRPVYLRDVAQVVDGPGERADYVLMGSGPAAGAEGGASGEAVTISISKRKGANAIQVASEVLRKVEAQKGTLIPGGVSLTVTRNYGETAQEKSDELLLHMLIAIGSVTALIWLTLGRRESGIVAVAIPVTLALTLAVFYLWGYTLNRVTLFALIFSIGILVDDAIVVVENIVRHYRMPENADRPVADVAVDAVDEVGNPTILATFTVIGAIVPMAFVSGLMGPYMRPIPVGATAAMVFSLLVAFVVTPWAAVRLLSREEEASHAGEESWTTRLYRRVMGALLHGKFLRAAFLAGVVALLLGACSLVYFRLVQVKMLPFDNKSEFQVVLDLPEGATLETTTAAARAVGEVLAQTPEVKNFQIYAGTSSPYNFNGLVRHYFLRRGPNEADIQVNLAPKGDRAAQSHEIATRLRPALQAAGRPFGANVKVAEVPPGPPVLQTLVAEVYGPDPARRIEIARQIKGLMEKSPGVVDVDWTVEDAQPGARFELDREKAAVSGVDAKQLSATLAMAVGGQTAGLLHDPREKEDVPLVVRLPVEKRSSVADLSQLKLAGAGGALVGLGEVARATAFAAEPNLYRKNLLPVVYVTGDVAGAVESPVYAISALNEELDRLTLPEGYQLERFVASQPFDDQKFSMKWDGEWHITFEVFRDLGLAFAVVLVLIYILVVGWFESFVTPIAIMAAIPFSLVGILPAHGLMGAFFTATSMIGFIAGAGIVVRNSIILVDFVELRIREGMPLDQAVVEAGAVRFRPMLLTAAAVIVGATVILFDPIFQGLALSLMAGEVASLLLSRVTVPVLYYLAARRKGRAEGGKEVATDGPVVP